MARPARRTRDDLRNLILDAAAEVIERDGLGVMSSTVTYKQVFDHLEETHGIRVTRGSVHERIWDSQRDFQLEVLHRAARWDARSSTDRTVEVAEEVFERGRANGWSPWDTLVEMTRVASAENYRAADDDDLYFAWTGLTLAIAQTVTADSEEYAELARSVTDSYATLTGDFHDAFVSIIDRLGLRIRPDLFESPDQALLVFTKLATALSEGVSLRRRFDDAELPDLRLATGPDGAIQPWHPFSVGMLALVHLFVEVRPDAGDSSAGAR